MKSVEQKLIDYLRKQHGLIVAELTAERTIGVASSEQTGAVNGRDAQSPSNTRLCTRSADNSDDSTQIKISTTV